MEKIYTFIDSQNLFKTFENNNLTLDLNRLYDYLKLRLKSDKIYLFLGYLHHKLDYYKELEEIGYTLIFRPVVKNKDGYKANVDCDLVLQAISELDSYDKAVIISNDGDYFNTIKYLISKNKFKNVISPERKTCSKLLRRACANKIIFADDILLYITQNPLTESEGLERLPTSEDKSSPLNNSIII